MERSPILGSNHRRKCKVFLLSDVRLYRDGLRLGLAHQQSMDVLGEGDFSDAALTRVVAVRPDVVILDIGSGTSFDFAKSIGAALPGTKIVAFAVNEVDDLVLACAEAGIAGYVSPEGSEQDLVVAVEHALRGELYCSPRIAGLLLRRVAALAGRPSEPVMPAALTRRERQIPGLLGNGMSNKEIGRTLRIGGSTVKNHVHNILNRLKVSRRGEAAAWLRSAEGPRHDADRVHRRSAAARDGASDKLLGVD